MFIGERSGRGLYSVTSNKNKVTFVISEILENWK